MPRRQGGARTDPRWHYAVEPAPGDLRIVQALVNSAGAGGRGEELSSPRALADWLARWGLMGRGAEPTPADLEQMRSVRAGLEAAIRASHGPPPAPEVVDRLDAAAASAPVRVRFDSAGGARFEADATGFAGALAGLFAEVALAHHDDRWQRLKLCPREGCGAAFYDFSSARAAKWCSRRCGNKGSSETYRGRRKRYRARQRRERPLGG